VSLHEFQNKVLDFHRLIGSHENVPLIGHDDLYQFSVAIDALAKEALRAFRATNVAAFLRIHLVLEELAEFAEAVDQDNRLELLDAYGDLLYVAFGIGVTYGVKHPTEVFNEIHRSNMTKQNSGDPRAQEKGDEWTPPNLEPYV